MSHVPRVGRVIPYICPAHRTTAGVGAAFHAHDFLSVVHFNSHFVSYDIFWVVCAPLGVVCIARAFSVGIVVTTFAFGQPIVLRLRFVSYVPVPHFLETGNASRMFTSGRVFDGKCHRVVANRTVERGGLEHEILCKRRIAVVTPSRVTIVHPRGCPNFTECKVWTLLATAFRAIVHVWVLAKQLISMLTVPTAIWHCGDYAVNSCHLFYLTRDYKGSLY